MRPSRNGLGAHVSSCLSLANNYRGPGCKVWLVQESSHVMFIVAAARLALQDTSRKQRRASKICFELRLSNAETLKQEIDQIWDEFKHIQNDRRAPKA